MSDRSGFLIDVRDLARRARRWVNARVTGTTVNAGFISFPLAVNDPERTAARQLVIRLRDKRVFTADDCCDNCAKNSIASLQDVRKILVDAQVQLANLHDGQLFWLIDYMLAAIRAFLTWEERMRIGGPTGREPDEFYSEDSDRTRRYVGQLDVIRAHVRVALAGIASIADMELSNLATSRVPTPLALAAEPRYLLTETEGE